MKVFCSALAILTFSAAWAGCVTDTGSSREDLEARLARYLAASEENHFQPAYEKAAKIYDLLIQKFPQEAVYYANDPAGGRALCQRSIKNFPAAVTDYTRALNHIPGNAWNYSGRALAWCSYTESDWTPSVQVDPLAVPVKNRTRALQDMERALLLKPEVPEFHVGCALIYVSLNQLKKAQNELNDALTMCARQGDVKKELARGIRDLQKNIADKLEDDASLTIDPRKITDIGQLEKWARVASHIAHSKGDGDRIKKARNETIGLCDRAIKLFPERVLCYVIRGETYYNIAQWKKAFSDLNKAIALDPTNPEPYFLRSTLWDERTYDKWSVENLDKALNDLAQALKLDPNNAWYYVRLGHVYGNGLRDLPKAKRAYRDAKLLNPAINIDEYLNTLPK